VYESPNVNAWLARAIMKKTASEWFSSFASLGPAPIYLHLPALLQPVPGLRLPARPPGVPSSTTVPVSFVAARLAVYRRSFVIA